MKSINISRDVPILRYENGKLESRNDPVIIEEWLKVYINDSLHSEIPVTPRDLSELVTGLLYGEGLIKPGDSPSIRFKGYECFVELPGAEPPAGLSDPDNLKAFSDDPDRWTPEDLFTLMENFQKLPSVYHETGGAHMAAFADKEIVHWADDISRRNAVDKVLGKGFMAGCDFSKGIILSSGRISSDMIIRMVRTGIPAIASISAPTDKAVELAEKFNVTVSAFVRGRRFNLYSGAQRFRFR